MTDPNPRLVSEGQRRRGVTKTLAMFVAVLAVASIGVSCSKKSDKKADSKTQESSLKECKGVDLKDTENLPIDCANALFQSRVAASKSEALQKLDDEKVRDIGSGLCAFAASVASDPTQVTDFDQLVKANAKNWGIDQKSTREVIDLAAVLCPADIARLKKMTIDQEPVTVTLEASGSAKVQVSYTGTSADKADQLLDPPWSKKVDTSATAPLELIVFPSSPEGVTTGCRIAVGDIELSRAEGGDGQMSVCRANPGDIRAAANGIAPQTQAPAAEGDQPADSSNPAEDPGAADTAPADAGEAGGN